MIGKLTQYVRSLDVRIVLIILLIIVSTGHVGRLFADREDVRQSFVGYVLAVSVDGVLAVSLYEVANVRKRSHRVFALFVFLAACAVSGGFNYAYYHQNYPQDQVWVSLLMGLTAPVLASFLAVLRALGDVQRANERETERDAERQAQLEMYAIEQAEQTKRVQIEQAERTKQVRANARAEQAKANAAIKAQRTAKRTQANGGDGRVKPGELDEQARVILVAYPDIGPRPLARQLSVSPSTASGILKRIRLNGGEEP